jgi:2OG-Fe(II) oxygenase superfamily
MLIHPFDRNSLKLQYAEASPFPFVKIDDFLDSKFAAQIAAAYPTFDRATTLGRSFKSVNERRKVQITDAKLFPDSIAQLNAELASPAFLSDLSYVTGIPDLLADKELVGGGIHMTGPGGRLDVHVDFNYLKERDLHRRINFLLYLNPVWDEKWGGHIQLWDRNVQTCAESFAPVMNRCVIFETSDISFHGVTPVTDEAPHPRCSFAAYYYTREAPPNWTGTVHSTVFRARPEERLRGYVMMPAEHIQQKLLTGTRRIKRRIRQVLKVFQ